MRRKLAIALFWILAILVTTVAWSGVSLREIVSGLFK